MRPDYHFLRIQTATIRDRKFRIRWRGLKDTSGQCDWPFEKGKLMHIKCKDRVPFEILMTVIHEFTHAAFFDLDEDSVTEFEKALHFFLIRMGIMVDFSVRTRPTPTHHAKRQKETRRTRTR